MAPTSSRSLVLAAALAAALPAFAQGNPPAAAEPAPVAAPAPAPAPTPAAQEQPAAAAADSPSRFSLRLATGLAVGRGAGNISLGAGFDVLPRFSLGVEVEYSPWFDYLGGKVAPGTINAYLTAALRWHASGGFEVRTGIFGGLSLLVFDTPGAYAGSVGIVVGTNVLRATVKLAERLAFEISPDAVLVVPSVRGVPLVYPQFRLTGALRFSL